MEHFGNLTLNEEFDQESQDDDVIGISRLTISDNTYSVPPKIMNRYMPHFPTLPSPLRNSFSFVDGDQMDIDECEDELTVNDCEPKIDENNKQEPKVTFVVPDKRNGRGEINKMSDENLEEVERADELEEEGEEELKKYDQQKEDDTSSTAVIKALMSPTSLGVAAATKMDGIQLESYPPAASARPEDDGSIQFSSGHHFQDINVDTIKQGLRSRSKTQPIHVSINNHHHYYPSYAEPRSVPHIPPPLHEDDRYRLPLPWSPDSHPIRRGSYAFMSYLQLFLNAITVAAIFSVVTSFFKTLKMDIKSTWEHKRLELAYESSQCQIQYLANKCNLGGRPALQEQCRSWEQCMNRDNDIFFRARSTLSAKLFGEIINSFIEPIGWKALLVIWMGIAVWVFCSNFLLGFARAKSYYGEHPQRARTSSSLQHQEQRPFLLQERDQQTQEGRLTRQNDLLT